MLLVAACDYGEFDCEIEKYGKVLIRGMTSTDGRTVSKYSQVFDMNIQKQCSAGAFTVSFSLPGPVNPRLFSQNFRSEGICEAVVVKYEASLVGHVNNNLSQNPPQKALRSRENVLMCCVTVYT